MTVIVGTKSLNTGFRDEFQFSSKIGQQTYQIDIVSCLNRTNVKFWLLLGQSIVVSEKYIYLGGST